MKTLTSSLEDIIRNSEGKFEIALRDALKSHIDALSAEDLIKLYVPSTPSPLPIAGAPFHRVVEPTPEFLRSVREIGEAQSEEEPSFEQEGYPDD